MRVFSFMPSKSPWSDLRRIVISVPLWGIPFALFFGTLFGASRGDYIGAYVASLVFALSINLCIWAVTWFVRPRLIPDTPTPSRAVGWQYSALYGGSSMFGSLLAAVVLHLTIMPGFLGGPRQVAVVLMFAMLFVVLFGALMYAVSYYRDSIERAKSDQELDLARRIQRSFLLSQFPALPRLEVYAVNVSSKQVSGDFYDVVLAGEDSYLLAIADVAGKGVPAALLSSMLQASLRTQAMTSSGVGAVLSNINTLVYRSTAVQQFATFFLARIEERTMRMSFSNAGHNYPVVFRRGGERVMLERGGTVVGILESATFEEDSIELRPGDRVVLYTDGISEAADASNDLFGEERLYACVERMPEHLSAQEITEGILAAVRAHLAGLEAGDDMTVMVLRVTEPTPA